MNDSVDHEPTVDEVLRDLARLCDCGAGGGGVHRASCRLFVNDAEKGQP